MPSAFRNSLPLFFHVDPEKKLVSALTRKTPIKHVMSINQKGTNWRYEKYKNICNTIVFSENYICNRNY